MSHEIIQTSGGVEAKAWVQGVQLEQEALQQIRRLALHPKVWPWLAVMPDAHWGNGATVGSVVPSVDAVIPSAVGVDIGCGMNALLTNLTADDIDERLSRKMFDAIVEAVPVGTPTKGRRDTGRWKDGDVPSIVTRTFEPLSKRYAALVAKHPKITSESVLHQLGSLGGGNHFIELCFDEQDRVWIMLHSGSRNAGKMIGEYFINTAKEEMIRFRRATSDRELAYLEQGTPSFDDYVEAVGWAQDYAKWNREVMIHLVVEALRGPKPKLKLLGEIISCHHNYISRETHKIDGFDTPLWVTRKGAVHAGAGVLGIIPGSMGTKSYIVRGRGNAESFMTCSHGAGRRLSRGKAKSTITKEIHAQDMKGIVCRLDEDVLDESPRSYKPIDDVMAAQSDLVEVVHTLRQFVNVKG